MSLEEFLATKELFYKDIDYDFFPSVWKRSKNSFKLPKIIHIIGTNGKGSTGRFLAYYLYRSGFNVGHYSSPHILKFNERVWLNGSDIDDNSLEIAHKKLQKKLDKDILKNISYFEYTTLLAIEIFQGCDYIILEAGLGGEYDATAVFDNYFTLVTPIGIDHENFLGDSLKKIASTKLRAVKNFAIFSDQNEIVYEVANSLGIIYYKAKSFFTKSELKDIKSFIKKSGFASYLAQNLTLAMSAVKKLDLKLDLTKMQGVDLRGRFQKISHNITIDVGHNEQAALAIKSELKDKKINLIYNTYKDKEYEKILSILKPNIKKLYIIELKEDRVIQKQKLQKILKSLKIAYEDFDIKELKSDEEYLVFGSFLVVERFLTLLHP